MDYLIGNKNGIIGFISIKDISNNKKTLYCSFENNINRRNPFDPELILQNPKYDSFSIAAKDEVIIEQILSKYIGNYLSIKDSYSFYWFEDNWAAKKREMEKIIKELLEKN